MSKYLGRMIKYVISEHKQPVVNVEASIKSPKDTFGGKKYLITGGGSGIGYEISKRLIDDGAHCIITGRNEEKLKIAVKKLGKNSEYFVCDVSNIEEMKQVFDKIIEKHKTLNGLINNAGVSLHEWDFLKVTPEGYDTQFNINLRGSFFLTQSYIKYCIQNGSEGNVLFISSERGSMAEVIPYGLTKAAVDSLVQGLSYKYYKDGIRVNAIAPGVTATEMTNKTKDEDLYRDNLPGRVFLPDEVAEVGAFLLSDYSKCISGQIIHTNGGNHIKFGW